MAPRAGRPGPARAGRRRGRAWTGRPTHAIFGRRRAGRRARGCVVRFENVGMRYGDGPEVLRDITMTLPPGSFSFLTGPSGAGKSTLLKLLYLAERPSRGLITLFGYDLATTKRRKLPALRRR